jgi:homoserine dehydrogenase
MTNSKKLTIGLFGFGVVGEGIYHVLQQTPTLNATIKKICIKHPDKTRNAPGYLFTNDPAELLHDKEINVIVELIDDAEAAFSIVHSALKNRKAVVSANKKMIASNLRYLIELQKHYDVPFLYEAAVCGSVPVIRNLEEYYDNDLLHSFSGIVNGSTNYILTKIKEEGISYNAALRQAQKLGFAESDPSLDVEGKDAVNKLSIVLQHAYGFIADPEHIVHKGITQLHTLDARYAAERGLTLKLVAAARRVSANELTAWVLPTFVESTNPLAQIRNEFNGVLIGSKLADEQFLYGKGAGRYPTSSAVLSDIAALRYDYRYEYKKARAGSSYRLTNQQLVNVFISFGSDAKVEESDLLEINETYKGPGRSYITGTISLSDLQQASWFYHDDVSVVLLGEHANEVVSEVTEELAYA